MLNRRLLLIMAILLAALLASCSVVFEAGISGKVVTEVETRTVPIEDVKVFAYTDRGARDSDYQLFIREENPITRPTEGAGYVAMTKTNANGEFTVNKIVWESKKSEFGKTADVNKLFLIFYHEDYRPEKTDATIISGSTNSDNVYIRMEGTKDTSTLNILVYDVSTSTLMDELCTLKYSVGESTETDSSDFTGRTTISISYPKNAEGTAVKLELMSLGTKWKMTDSAGNVLENPVEEAVLPGNNTISLYMKNYEFILPAFSGYIDNNLTVIDSQHPGSRDNVNDNIRVWVEYLGTDNTWHQFKQTLRANHLTRSVAITNEDPLIYAHGRFSNVGNDGYNIRVNDETTPEIKFTDSGINIWVSLRIAFDMSDIEHPHETIRYYEFKYYLQQTRSDLGYVTPAEGTLTSDAIEWNLY